VRTPRRCCRGRSYGTIRRAFETREAYRERNPKGKGKDGGERGRLPKRNRKSTALIEEGRITSDARKSGTTKKLNSYLRIRANSIIRQDGPRGSILAVTRDLGNRIYNSRVRIYKKSGSKNGEDLLQPGTKNIEKKRTRERERKGSGADNTSGGTSKGAADHRPRG